MFRFSLNLLFLLFVTVSAFGQDTLEKDLLKSFKKFELLTLDRDSVLDKARSNQEIRINAYGREFAFSLTPNDLRTADYKAIENYGNGKRALQRADITVYKGKLNGDHESEVRINIAADGVEGLIYTGDGQKFFISAAEKFSNRANEAHSIFYNEADLIKSVDLTDDAVLLPPGVEEKINFGLEILNSNGSDNSATSSVTENPDATANLRTIEVATEADYQWVTQAGGATAANSEILRILNLVDGIYQRDLGLNVTVTYQHAWTTPDPFSSNSTIALLDSYLAYWNSNFPYSQYPRDVTHLFTGKFSNQGVAYSGVTCRNPSYSYGLIGRSNGVNHLMVAHEIAHNLGADHVDNSGSCANSLMNPVLSGGVSSFCSTSVSQLTNYVAANGSCLSGSSTPACTYSINSFGQSFAAAGGAGSIGITTQSGCSWTAVSNQGFVGINAGTSGSGSGTIFYYVLQNTNVNSRSATITVAGQNYTIQQNGAVITNTSSPTRFDFDGDGRADVSVFRPSTGAWYISRSADNSFFGVNFGQNGDLIAPADFDGDRKTDISVFRPSNGTWYRLNSSTGQPAATQFGQYGDIPVPGDYDGDGRADISVFRPSNGTWYRLNSSTGQFIGSQFGQYGDTPLNGDFDGDGKSDLAVFRPSVGVWYVLRSSSNSFYGVNFGQVGDAPTAADFDGDGITDFSVYRSSTASWYRLNSSNNSFFAQQFGTNEDKPTSADYDGDGRADISVFRPSSANWFLQTSASGFRGVQFGISTDVPSSTVLTTY